MTTTYWRLEAQAEVELDTQKLADEDMLVKYNIEVRNRFQALANLEEQENANEMNIRTETIAMSAQLRMCYA